MSKVKKGFQAAILVAGFALITGCASTSQVEEARAETEAVRGDLQRALQMAEEANRKADQALEAARAAQQAADAGEQCCQDVRQELDRALQRMQRK
ncbi:hypothetical protein F6455_03430 [Proteobacteria bacterium 005FR1]|nr:hypothetical protein [Proteobacteria bacterium 005FR1]